MVFFLDWGCNCSVAPPGYGPDFISIFIFSESKQPCNYKLTELLFTVYLTFVLPQPYSFKLIVRLMGVPLEV